MTLEPEKDELVGRWADEDHSSTCTHACYRCLERYGNRSYHGLLDWRLGLSYLRLLVTPGWRAGLDGWKDAFYMRDWPSMAEDVARAIFDLSPDRRARGPALGPHALPSVVEDARRYVVVHPFWRDVPVPEDEEGRSTVPIDTFEGSRRLTRALASSG